MAETKKTVKATAAPKAASKPAVALPEVHEFLKAGVQFGHQGRKWNPKMKPYIFGKRDNIHIIDIAQTMEALQKAAEFLREVAKTGNVLFVGSKRQAADIVKKTAMDSGAYYIIHRWPGGLLTNFNMIQRSLKRYNGLEQEFEQGVEDRTKFEISLMKKEWDKMNRLYEGIKSMSKYPSAIVVVDTNFEKGAIREAKSVGIPVVGIVDTNCDPESVDYPIPANDDAIRSIQLIVGLLGAAVKQGNEGKGVVHNPKDYLHAEVKIIRKEQEEEEKVEVGVTDLPVETKIIATSPAPRKASGKGLLEDIQKEKETKTRQSAIKSRKK